MGVHVVCQCSSEKRRRLMEDDFQKGRCENCLIISLWGRRCLSGKKAVEPKTFSGGSKKQVAEVPNEKNELFV